MRTLAPALVGICVVAAASRPSPAPRQGSRFRTESGPADLAACATKTSAVRRDRRHQRRRPGVDPSIDRLLDRARFTTPQARAQAERVREDNLRGLGRLERRDLISPLSRFLADPALSDPAYLALALTLRAHASAENPDEEITLAVNGLVLTAPAAILGQLPYSNADQFETAQGRLAAMLDDVKGPRATAARGLEALARRNRGSAGSRTRHWAS